MVGARSPQFPRLICHLIKCGMRAFWKLYQPAVSKPTHRTPDSLCGTGYWLFGEVYVYVSVAANGPDLIASHNSPMFKIFDKPTHCLPYNHPLPFWLKPFLFAPNITFCFAFLNRDLLLLTPLLLVSFKVNRAAILSPPKFHTQDKRQQGSDSRVHGVTASVYGWCWVMFVL